MTESPLGFRARDERERIMLGITAAAARARSCRSLTTQQIAEQSGVPDAVVQGVVGDVEACVLAACAWSANRAFAVALDAYQAPATWPEKVSACIFTLTDLLATAEDIVTLHVLVLPTLGPIGMERAFAEREAFTAFLTAGADESGPSMLPASADFVSGAIFQVLATLAGEHRIHELPRHAPDLIRVVLTPFCEPDVIDGLITRESRPSRS